MAPSALPWSTLSPGRKRAQVTLADEVDAENSIAAATAAYHELAGSSREQRMAWLARLHEVVADAEEELIATMIEEYGGPHGISVATSKRAAASFDQARTLLADYTFERQVASARVRMEPLGIRKGIEEGAILLLGGPTLTQGLMGSHREHAVNKAISWIREHYDAPLKIAQLAEAVHLSPSVLHRRFKAATIMSPLQYQKQVRLLEARKLLRSGGVEAANVAFQVGYESPSQFSREYRRLFGASPLQDAEQLRGVAPSP